MSLANTELEAGFRPRTANSLKFFLACSGEQKSPNSFNHLHLNMSRLQCNSTCSNHLQQPHCLQVRILHDSFPTRLLGVSKDSRKGNRYDTEYETACLLRQEKNLERWLGKLSRGTFYKLSAQPDGEVS